jgi:hypothetical protein
LTASERQGTGGGVAAPAPTGHSRFGASKAERWLHCTASVAAEAPFPDTETEYAREGTALHAVAALCLESGQDAVEYVDREVEGFTIYEEQAEAVQVFLDTIRADKAARGGKLLVEQRFHLDWLHPEFFGTGDCLRLGSDNVLSVYDAKFGRGVAVEVVKPDGRKNPQLAYYGLGGIEKLKRVLQSLNLRIDRVELVVVQPRAPHRDGPVRRVTLDHSELMELSDDLVLAAAEADGPNAKFVAGDWCKFCKAAGACKALRDFALEAAQADFDDDGAVLIAPRAPGIMTDAEVAAALKAAPVIEGWLKSLEAHATGLAKAGAELPGFKLVPGITRRRWRDAERAASELSLVFGLDDSSIYAKKIVSPTQAEKLLDKGVRDALKPLIEKPEGALRLVPDTDAREGRPASAQTDFAD